MSISLQRTNDEAQCSSDTSRTLVVACGAIAHELIAVIKANELQHLDIQCLPAEWHNTPDRITPAIEKKIRQYKDRYQQIFVAYADCGTGGQLDALLRKHDIQRLPGDHCYGFFSGQDVFEAMAEEAIGTFYLTDYLVDNFQRLIMDNLGIDTYPELRDQYFQHYTRLLYLRQDTQGSQCTSRMHKAQAAATSLGLPLSVHDTGLKRFEHSLARIIPIAAH